MKYTKQEAFDKVVEHLIKQGKPSVDEFGSCQYHSEDGLKCAAGCLIKDSKLRKKVSGEWEEACDTYPSLKNLAPFDFVDRLQSIHDNGAYNRTLNSWRFDWVTNMKELAKSYKLKVGLLNKLVPKEWTISP